MTSVRLVPEAKEELRAAARYYESQQPGLGVALTREVRLACKRIAERPMASRVERNDIHVHSLLRFPYHIYYRVRADEILVIAVGHRRRGPGFWTTRA